MAFTDAPVTASAAARQRRVVMWTIWFSLLSAVVIYQMVLGHGIPAGRNPPDATLPPVTWLALAQLAGATMLRWVILPREIAPTRQLVWMILGLALCEAVEFYGLFLVPADQPETKLAFWIAALLGTAQFAPFYATRSVDRDPFHQPLG